MDFSVHRDLDMLVDFRKANKHSPSTRDLIDLFESLATSRGQE